LDHAPIAQAAVEGTLLRQASPWPARLDLAQSLSGLALALFMWAHMLLVASILVSERAMWIVALIVAAVSALFVAHALLALRKVPSGYREHRLFREHARRMRHEDTSLWYWQVLTGFAMFFLAAPHLYYMLTHPDRIGPYESADRVWSDGFWMLYLVLLFAVEIHGGVGLYRLALKWGVLEGRDLAASRRRLRIAKWSITAFLIVLGLAGQRVAIAVRRRGFQPIVLSLVPPKRSHSVAAQGGM
jgi:fumarate reductase subunit C